MKLRIEKKVTIITPSIGSDKLKKCIESVSEQNYGNLIHLIVSDGPQFYDNIISIIDSVNPYKNPQVVCSPENTGSYGFYGHRIYAAYPQLINSDYIFFLDEDNWYATDHVRTMVEVLDNEPKLNFVFSLRNIYSEDEKFICPDNCESLGLWPIWMTHSDPGYLVDTSSYGFRKEFIQSTCHLWASGWGADRRFFYMVKDKATYTTTGLHTLQYRLDGNPNSVKPEFFLEGNRINSEYYEGNFPWENIKT